MSDSAKQRYTRSQVFGRQSKKPRITRKKFSRVGLLMDRVTRLLRPTKKTPAQPTSRFAASKESFAPKATRYAPASQRNDAKMRILKPKPDYFVKEAIKAKVSLAPKKAPRKFNWGQKDLSELTRKVKKFRFSFHGLNYYLVKWQVRENFNAFLVKTFTLLAIVFIGYLSFFDTFFLIKNYTITYAAGSYLDEAASQEMVQNLKDNRILGIFPNNQLWFINDQNLTLTAQESVPRVETIRVTDRVWPNAAKLEVTTVPTLLTLEINNGELWRVDTLGRVISRDTAQIQENVVVVEGPVSFDVQGASFQDYPLYQDQTQLNRLFFIDWLWQTLDERDIEIVRTSIPSLQDGDVTVTTQNGTRLRFNSEAIRKNLQLTRLDGFLANSNLAEELARGSLDYVDFRIPKRIFVCRDGQFCARRASR